MAGRAQRLFGDLIGVINDPNAKLADRYAASKKAGQLLVLVPLTRAERAWVLDRIRLPRSVPASALN